MKEYQCLRWCMLIFSSGIWKKIIYNKNALAANPSSNIIREMWWRKSYGQSQSMTSAEFHGLCVYIDFHLLLQISWQSLHLGVQFGVEVGFGEGVVVDPHSTGQPQRWSSWAVLFLCTGLSWLGHFAWFLWKLRSEKESLPLFSSHKRGQIYLCTVLLGKLAKMFPKQDIWQVSIKM